MAELKIPKENEEGLKKLIALDDESVQDLFSALGEVSPILSSIGLSSKVASKVDTIPRSDVDDIVGVLLPLYLLREHYEVSTSEMAEDVCRGLDRSDDEEIRLSGEDREHFKSRLIELLDVESIRIGAKGLEVLFENQRSFLGARIVTEIRPIFGSNPEEAPAGALVVHMLKITYREDGQDNEFFVALDTTDVGTLRNALDRADTKVGSLKELLEKARIAYVDPE